MQKCNRRVFALLICMITLISIIYPAMAMESSSEGADSEIVRASVFSIVYDYPIQTVTAITLIFLIIIVFIFSVNREKYAQAKILSEKEEQSDVLQLITSSMDVVLMVVQDDEKRTITFINENIFTLLGYERDEYLSTCANTMYASIYPDDRDRVMAESTKSLLIRDNFRCEYRMVKKDGQIVWVMCSGERTISKDGDARINLVLTDITALQDAIGELRYKAEYDELTGVYNLRAFYDRTHDMLVANLDTKFILIRMDINHFKLYNDQFGTLAGDALLRRLARYIKEAIVKEGTYGRLTADHFAMCIPIEGFDAPRLVTKTRKFLKGVSDSFELIPCFGFYLIDDIGLPVSLMCDRAHLAQQSIKDYYTVSYAFYDDKLRAKLVQEQEIINDMVVALEEGQFKIYLQPLYNQISERIVGAEALARWFHPARGFISPNVFVQIFEKNGFIHRFDAHIWELACITLKSWQQSGLNSMFISVNISRIDIMNPNLCTILTNLVKKHNVPPEMLRLEITESAYVENPTQLIETVTQLQSYGFIVEMDDFGSGYSSLNSLKDVPFDVIKLDLKFLKEDSGTGRGGNILSSVVRMVKWLGLPVIAEGVETGQQAAFLKSIGCELIQGYYFSKPLPAKECEALIRKHFVDENEPTRKFTGLASVIKLLDPASDESEAFGAAIGATMLIEYNGAGIEILKSNDRVFSEIGETKLTMNEMRLNLLDAFTAESRQELNDILSGDGKSLEPVIYVAELVGKERPVFLRMHISRMASNGSRQICFVLLENVSRKY